MHNFLVYHARLNSSKNCFKYVPFGDIQLRYVCLDDFGSKVECGSRDLVTSEQYIVSRKQRMVVPSWHHRGIIARSVAYMCLAYPHLVEQIFTDVADPATILGWHGQYPVSKFEYDRNKFISFIQGNENPFVLYPDSLSEAFLEGVVKGL
jgi:hypothetical protein